MGWGGASLSDNEMISGGNGEEAEEEEEEVYRLQGSVMGFKGRCAELKGSEGGTDERRSIAKIVIGRTVYGLDSLKSASLSEKVWFRGVASERFARQRELSLARGKQTSYRFSTQSFCRTQNGRPFHLSAVNDDSHSSRL